MSNYKYVPANLTVDTFIDRVRAGEVFYTEDNEPVYYDTDWNNPFRYDDAPILWGWDRIPYLSIRVETTWQDELSEEGPVICWVSNKDSIEKTELRAITDYDTQYNFPFVSTQGDQFPYATPVLPNECRPVDQ